MILAAVYMLLWPDVDAHERTEFDRFPVFPERPGRSVSVENAVSEKKRGYTKVTMLIDY